MNNINYKESIEKIKKNNACDKFLVKFGVIAAPIETGAAIMGLIYGENLNAITLGVCALGTAYGAYKLNKKTKVSEENIKNLETKLGKAIK